MKTRSKPRYVDLREAAVFFCVHRLTLYRIFEHSRIRGAFKIGRVWRVDLDEALRSFKAGTIRPKG